jgi:hypothetical protein
MIHSILTKSGKLRATIGLYNFNAKSYEEIAKFGERLSFEEAHPFF